MTGIYRIIVENIEDFFVILDKRGYIRSYTQEAKKELGLGDEIGIRLEDLGVMKPEGIWRKRTKASEILWEHGEVRKHLILRNIPYDAGFILSFRKGNLLQSINSGFTKEWAIDKIPGISEEIRKKARKASRNNIPVLITGESGTGKEVLARGIHDASGREGRFIPVNCVALPKDLVESELFGYESGTFTGARKGGKSGKFQLADKGTILLDEIAEMLGETQPKLLRVIEERKVWKLGASEPEEIDFKLISVTNSNIEKLTKKGAFRKDLYHRVASLKINLPPLRERMEFFDELLSHFLKKHGGEDLTTTSEVMTMLKNYPYPGNIRELEQIVEFLIIEKKNSGSKKVKLEDLPEKVREDKNNSPKTLPDKIETLKKREIEKALRKHNDNKTKTAKELGISRRGLYKTIKKLNLGT